MPEETIFDLKRRLVRQRRGDPKGPWDRFYEFLVVESSTVLPDTPNWEANAMFEMIKMAFDGSGTDKPVTINPYLIHNLAACCSVSLLYNKNKKIPWDTNEHDDILGRTYTGFAHTVIGAAQRYELQEMNGKLHFGGLAIPRWFSSWALSQAAKQ